MSAASPDQPIAMSADERAPSEEGYGWRATPPSRPDWQGAKRDALYFLGYQIVGVAVLYVMPESVSGWTDEEKQNYSFSKWRYNVSHPHMDSDTFFVNYVTHPYWGATYYTRARERGLDRTESFWFSAMMSALWEYGAEALAEQVSIQDLFATPILGSLIGEYVFAPWRERIRAKSGELDWMDKAVLIFTDPLGVINAQVDQWTGMKTSIQIGPSHARANPAARGPAANASAGQPSKPANGWSVVFQAQW